MNKHRIQFKSITHKNAVTTALIGLILIFLLSMVWPRLFYMIAKSKLTTYISGTVSECSVRISYLLSNHKVTMDLRKDDTVLSLIREYYQGASEKKEILQNMLPHLSRQVEGPMGDGSIQSTNYTLLATDQGDCFYNESEKNLAESFMKTDVLQNICLDESGNFYSDEYYFDSDGKCYTPVIYLDIEGSTVGFLGFIGAFLVDDIPCYAISLMPFDDIIRQLDALTEIGVHDFALFCHDRPLFLNQDASLLPSFTNSAVFPSPQQYDVVSDEYEDGILFRVLCSYPSEGLYLTVNATRAELIAPYKDFFYLLELCLCLLILLMVLIFTIIFRISMNRLKKLDQEMCRVRSGDFDIVLKDDGIDEIGNIAETINMMVATIKTNLEQQITSEKLEKEMQYSLLVSAIDPHFIYNTLDTITFLAAMGKCQDIMLVNNALIGTLKDRIKMKHLKIYDSVENEKKVVEQYMIIQSYLYANPIDFQFLVTEEDASLKIPKNIIQPLVENAIKHGLMPNKDQSRTQTKDGQIIVQVSRQEHSILLSVTDNGIGMDEKKREFYLGDIDKSNIDPEHIGLLNMRLRLSYLYQENFDFQIQCPECGGTSVIIQLKETTQS